MDPVPDLDVLIDFVNTRDIGDDPTTTQEYLDSPAALSAFIAEHGLGQVQARPVDVRRAHELREALRALMLANNGGAPDPAAIDVLNGMAARSKVLATFDDHASWRIEPAAAGVDNAFGRMLASVFEAMSDGSWSRMKACGNPDCRWAFYDESKNRSGRWCDMAVCGNRMKARAFRQRTRRASQE